MDSDASQAVWLKRLEAWEAEPGYGWLRDWLESLCPVALVSLGAPAFGPDHSWDRLPIGAVLLDDSGSSFRLLEGRLGTDRGAGLMHSDSMSPNQADPFNEIEYRAAKAAWLDALEGRTVIVHGWERGRSPSSEASRFLLERLAFWIPVT